MITRELVNEIIGIKESYELPEKLMSILKDKNKRENVFNQFLEHESDLSYDWFTQYFQEEHGDRNSLKQDFTPDCICEILDKLTDKSNTFADICSGTGGLTIKKWNSNKDAFYYCEEISSRALPLLLFNLAIRGVNGKVIHGNSLSKEVDTVYNLTREEKFSDIEVGIYEDYQVDKVISNPPYSLKWEADSFKNDSRFIDYGLAPKSKADYAFALHGLSKLKEAGKIFLILPHGVLFRGNQEGEIRKKLIETNMIESVIGLPNNLFLNTSIPVCILVLNKNKTDNNIFFIDSSKDFIKEGKQNNMTSGHIEKLICTYKIRQDVDKYSHLATMEEIEKSDYNLNIPMYVDISEPEEIPDIMEVVKELHEIDMEIAETEKQLFKMMNDLIGGEDFNNSMKEYSNYLNQKYNGDILPKNEPIIDVECNENKDVVEDVKETKQKEKVVEEQLRLF